MARIFFSLSGKTDNLVFVSRNGQTFARSLPAKVKQTAATKKRSSNFGIASAAGKVLRAQLLPVLLQPKDRSMQIRLAGAIAKWLAQQDPAALPSQTALPFISSFPFSEKTTLQERLLVPLTITELNDNTISINLPALTPVKDIVAPAYTIRIKMVITVAACGLLSGKPTGSDTKIIEITYNKEIIPAQTILFNQSLLPGSLLIIAASMQYTLRNQTVCTKPAFMPCSIIDAQYIGT